MQEHDGASHAWNPMNGKVLDLIDHSPEIRLRQGSAAFFEARVSMRYAGAALHEQLAVEGVLCAVSRRLADTSAPDMLRTMETSLGELAEALGYGRCTFSELIEGDYLNVLCSCATGDIEPLPRGRFPYRLPWFLGQLRAGRTVALSNLPDDLPADAVEEKAHCRRIGLRSCLSIPVRVGRRITAAFTFSSMHRARAWPPETVARLTMLGEMLGGALALARAEDEASERQRAWHADRVERANPPAAAPLEPDHKARPDDFGIADAAADEIAETALVCVIDGDPGMRASLVRLLGAQGWLTRPYPSADAFLAAQPPAASVACMLLDVRMPGTSGLDLQRHLVQKGCAPAVIFITDHGDVVACVEAMKLGASDFLVKPVDARVLVEAVRKAVTDYHARREQALSQSTLMRRISSLSTRERQIMEHVIEGRLNKQIAADLLITEQTVKQHRGRVMDKMEVRSVAQLVRACEAIGLFQAPTLK
ncbi:response regulator [Variovorax robiniae]|uniref:Response regulator n=1 Tax=Variovorax robiniae TaxID=1836199 RepID=A0ABU8XC94_9BURK